MFKVMQPDFYLIDYALKVVSDLSERKGVFAGILLGMVMSSKILHPSLIIGVLRKLKI